MDFFIIQLFRRLAFFILMLFFSFPLYAAEIWVSPNGSDKNSGSKDQPMATLNMALRKAREMRRLNNHAVQEGVRIILRGGVYPLVEPVLIRPEDSGTEEIPTVIEGVKGEYPVLSGGVPVSNWRKAQNRIPGLPKVAAGNIWVADAPKIGGRIFEFRQMWVNGKKALRARDRELDNLNRIIALNKETEEMWIPIPESGIWDSEVTPVEMVILQRWAIAILRIKDIKVEGSRAKLTFYQPESRIQFEHPWPQPVIDEGYGNSAYYLTNSIQFLDRPGEWYLDLAAGKVYYWPLPEEDMRKVETIIPVLETLVKISGTLDRPVKHVHFKGIGFEHTSWLRPSYQGHVPLQTGMFLYDAYKLEIPGLPEKASLENQAWIGRPPSGVEVRGAHNTKFIRCKFRHMASTGLDYVWGTKNSVIEGNIFNDIGGNGILLGAFPDEGVETHVPYDPSDEREICTNERIANNLVIDVTNEDWGCVGIGVGYARGVNIEHNEISHVNYSGISLGWGWTKWVNAMRNNRVYANYIHHFAKQMFDVGGIYTLSAQPATDIYENVLDELIMAPYAHDPNHYQFIYFDEGSSFIRAFDNWTPYEKFFANSNGPGTLWENNGPKVSNEIKEKTGLQEEYKDLLKEIE